MQTLGLNDFGTKGGWLINESGFYSLILRSDMPKAKELKRWVTSEVLPQTRKTGGYIPIEKEEVEIIEYDGEFYSTGIALGYARNNEKSTGVHRGHPLFPRKDRIDKILENDEIVPVVHGVQSYLTEEQLYDFMLEARTEKCKSFRKWVTNEVLPTILTLKEELEEIKLGFH